MHLGILLIYMVLEDIIIVQEKLLHSFVDTFISIQNKEGLDNYLKGIKESKKDN